MVAFAAVAIVVLCVTLLALTGVWFYNRRFVSLPSAPRRWELTEHSDGELEYVYCECPGEERFLVGAVPWHSQDFEYEIEELRSRGRQKLVALNSESQ